MDVRAVSIVWHPIYDLLGFHHFCIIYAKFCSHLKVPDGSNHISVRFGFFLHCLGNNQTRGLISRYRVLQPIIDGSWSTMAIWSPALLQYCVQIYWNYIIIVAFDIECTWSVSHPDLVIYVTYTLIF